MRTTPIGNIFGIGNLLRGCATLVTVVFLAGCASTEKMVPVSQNHSREATVLFADGIVLVQKNSQPHQLELAVKQSLENADWLSRRTGGQRYSLQVSVDSESPITSSGSGLFFKLSGTMYARYVLKDNSSRTVFDETIWSEGVHDANEPYAGINKIPYVIERRYKNNISEFFRRLDKFAIAESKRKSTEVASKQQTEMVEKLNQYDIFSSVPFYVAYKPIDFGNYNFADVMYSSKSTIEPKLQSATLLQLRSFQSVYGDQLSTGYIEFVQNLIKDKEAVTETKIPNSKPREAIKTTRPVPKPQPTSKPEQSVDKKPQAEQPVKAQPAPNPF